jgi:tRNA-modifying protein YgfZ
MLNLDKLGGISFTKGCYTGQEVVARTHYLGKAKRELFLAETTDEGLLVNAYILSKTDEITETEKILGNVLSYVQSGKTYRMLVVLQTSAINEPLLKVDTMKQSQITLIPFATA